MSNRWIQVQFVTSREEAPELEDLFLDAGALAVTLQDNEDNPIFEPELGETPLWQNTRITALFDADFDGNACAKQIAQAFSGQLAHQKIELLENKDWERAWMEHYTPMKFGENLWIVPSWTDAPDPEATNLLLDPGLAFGTGTHPTTALCLTWLSEQEVKDAHVLDWGCGSGVLAIAALLLGADTAEGIDIDHQALAATTSNADRNNIDQDRLHLGLIDSYSGERADITIANILAGPLVELAPTLAEATKEGGKIVLSGILREQADAICEAYRNWFDLNPVAVLDDWVRIDGTKR